MLEKHYGRWMDSEAPNMVENVEAALEKQILWSHFGHKKNVE